MLGQVVVALRRQFEVSLVYRVTYRIARATQRNPVCWGEALMNIRAPPCDSFPQKPFSKYSHSGN